MWFQIGGVLLEHFAERGRHRRTAGTPEAAGPVVG
jgi:hypothetical protein